MAQPKKTRTAYLRQLIGSVISWTWLVATALWVSPRFVSWLISINARWIQWITDWINTTPASILAKLIIAFDQGLASAGRTFNLRSALVPFFSLAGLVTILGGWLLMQWLWNRLVLRWKRYKLRKAQTRQTFEEEITEDLPAEPEPEPKFTFPLTEVDDSVDKIKEAARKIRHLSTTAAEELAELKSNFAEWRRRNREDRRNRNRPRRDE
ncbi:hypothetical protein KW798_03310 [Candidatus Parcubacteria bacterium]|nr:hypothetical protein [Candidatus Parcubacteria bacterium]